MLSNKDGRYSWRPLQLIHPALYVSLVFQITELDHWTTIKKRFGEFADLKNFSCLSIPVKSVSKKRSNKAAQILQWWSGIEQASIALALDYSYVFHADIADCYSSIYTHSIAWAIHGRDIAKANKGNRGNKKSLLGNIIDRHIQEMSYGQTNGIPQGSVLMDFIAELVLGYADQLLSDRLANCKDYKILRYRDDYRIFVNDTSTGEYVLKSLTEVLIGLGLKLNTLKTTGSQSVVISALKPDKRAFLRGNQKNSDLRKHLLVLHAHGVDFPNSGSLTTALSQFHQRLTMSKRIRDPITLISIAVDIARTSPRTFRFCVAIISKLLACHLETNHLEIINKIHNRLSQQLPNIGQMEVWLQRISYPYDPIFKFHEPLCQLICGESVTIWNSEWIKSELLKKDIDARDIIDMKKLKAMKRVVQSKEIDLFSYD